MDTTVKTEQTPKRLTIRCHLSENALPLPTFRDALAELVANADLEISADQMRAALAEAMAHYPSLQD